MIEINKEELQALKDELVELRKRVDTLEGRQKQTRKIITDQASPMVTDFLKAENNKNKGGGY
jgi:predicted  nucleic acid-binding Zn-ribbon protein